MTRAEELLGAVKAGDVEKVKELLVQDASLAKARDANGMSALMLAKYRMSPPLVEAIAAHRRDLDIFEAASLGRDREVADLLTRDRALAKAYAPDGFTALHLACFFGNEAVAQQLLAAGADPNTVAKSPTRVTPLHSAAASRKASCVRMVLEAGAKPDAQQQHGYTALMSAALHNDIAMTEALLQRGARKDIRTDDGKMAADFAREKGFNELAQRLAS